MEAANPLAKFVDVPFPLDYAFSAPRVQTRSPTSLFGGHIQTGSISLLNSSDNRALDIWEKQIRKGSVKKVEDEHVKGQSIEITGNNPLNNFITTPIGIHQTLGIRLPNFIMLVKNIRKMFLFDIMFMDDRNLRRRLRFSNRQSTSRIKPTLSYIPLRLDDGWNVVQVNLMELSAKIFGTTFREVMRVQIYGCCRLKRIMFTEISQNEESIPTDFKTYLTNTFSKSSVVATNSNA